MLHAAARNRHVTPVRGQRERDAAADAGASARHQRDAALQEIGMK
jgi:hypothetical protein